MNGLLIAAHGSQMARSNREIEAFTARLARADSGFDLVRHGFLELTSPDIATAADELVASGATAIVVFPYFLAAGRHVTEDVPAIVAALTEKHPDIAIQLAPHLGDLAGLDNLILGQLAAASPTS